ncbi:MAG TPA: response regulator [Syntrophobacter fumaroxidans]|nr:response regulator [Syntrophobacter fumaroxidans]
MSGEERKQGPKPTQQTETTPQGFTGTVSLELTDLIQMLCLSRSDLIIRVKSHNGIGIIYVKEGQVYHAHTESLQGESAFFEILRWKDGHFEMIPFRESEVKSVSKSWEHLLIEAMRQRDELPGAGGGSAGFPDGPGSAARQEDEDLEFRIDNMFDELEQVAKQVMEEEERGTATKAQRAAGDPGTARPPQVLIVDDSPFFSRQLKKLLEEEGSIEVVGTAKNGRECVDFLATEPAVDLITLDVEMPVMPGDTALKHIMIRHPIPVLILSAFEAGSLNKVFEFLQLGAVDFAAKPRVKEDLAAYSKRLRELVKGTARAHVSHFRRWRRRQGPAVQTEAGMPSDRLLIVLGAEGAYMDWFRLPLSRLARNGTIIGLQKISDALLAEFCKLIDRENGSETVPIVDSMNISSGRFYLGNACRKAGLEYLPESMSLKVQLDHPGDVDWQEGVLCWLDQLAVQTSGRMSVYFLSAAQTLPRQAIERLLEKGLRLILPPRDTAICTEMLDAIQSISSHFPEQVLWATQENLMEVW